MKEAARQQGGFLLLGRIVPTEAKPSELSGEILWAHQGGVKAKSDQLQIIKNKSITGTVFHPTIELIFALRSPLISRSVRQVALFLSVNLRPHCI
jgi:hypothetical protein